LGIKVVGVSVDSVERLQRFRDKYELGFVFASDSERKLGTAYGTLRSEEGSHNRDTVLIGQEGTVLAVYEKAKAKGHAARVLDDARSLLGESGT